MPAVILLSVSLLCLLALLLNKKLLAALLSRVAPAGPLPVRPKRRVESAPAQKNVEAYSDELTMEFDDLQWLLDKKKTELRLLAAEQSLKDENAVRLDAIEDTIEVIENRLLRLQHNLGNVRQTVVQLDELTILNSRLHRELAQCKGQWQSALEDNGALREELDEVREYAADLKQQRQQLQKQLNLLEDMRSAGAVPRVVRG
jgi:chromosome segregation ATPase